MVRLSVLVLFCISLMFAAFLGFSSITLGHDKAIHFVTFFVLTTEFYLLWETHRPWKLTILIMTLGASVTSEYVQNFVNPNRKFDYMDIIFNIHGSALAVAVCCLVHSFMTRRRLPARDFSASIASAESSDTEGYVNVKMSDIEG
ncbi:hypothetical protein OXX59_000697 [Metschnikowia pulcherrima]